MSFLNETPTSPHVSLLPNIIMTSTRTVFLFVLTFQVCFIFSLSSKSESLAKRNPTRHAVDFSHEQASMTPSSLYHDAYYDPFSIEHHGEPTIYPSKKKGNKRKSSESSIKSSLGSSDVRGLLNEG